LEGLTVPGDAPRVGVNVPVRPQGALIVPGAGARRDANGVGPLTPPRFPVRILAYIYREPGTGIPSLRHTPVDSLTHRGEHGVGQRRPHVPQVHYAPDPHASRTETTPPHRSRARFPSRRALFSLALGTGLRLRELAGLNVGENESRTPMPQAFFLHGIGTSTSARQTAPWTPPRVSPPYRSRPPDASAVPRSSRPSMLT